MGGVHGAVRRSTNWTFLRFFSSCSGLFSRLGASSTRGLDDPEVSQYFIDWYTFSHLMHGVAVYVAIRMFANIRPPIAMGILISVGVAGLWEVVENMPFIVDSSIKQAFATQAPVAFILSPLLTGGNPAAHTKLKV